MKTFTQFLEALAKLGGTTDKDYELFIKSYMSSYSGSTREEAEQAWLEKNPTVTIPGRQFANTQRRTATVKI